MNPCLLALALLQVGSPVDEGVLVVRVDTVEVARESFRLTHGRLSRGDVGWTLATTIRYDRARADPRGERRHDAGHIAVRRRRSAPAIAHPRRAGTGPVHGTPRRPGDG